MQKHHLLALSLMLALITTPLHGGWFDNEEKKEKERLQQQLAQEQSKSDGLIIVAAGLGVFTVIAFTIGTMLGSRTRKKGGDSQ